MRDNIKKLLGSPNISDRKIGLSLATEEELVTIIDPSRHGSVEGGIFFHLNEVLLVSTRDGRIVKTSGWDYLAKNMPNQYNYEYYER